MARPANEVQLVNLLSSGVIQDADSRAFAEGLLAAAQDLLDDGTDQILALQDLQAPWTCPVVRGTDGLSTLDYLLWLVGFTDELWALVSNLSDRRKRLLAGCACALWKAKGLPWGWQRSISLLTGVPSWSRSYQDWRYLVDDTDGCSDGEDVLVDPSGGSDVGAWESDLYVQDPQDATMQTVIASLVDLGRPAGERVTIRWVDLLEQWNVEGALARWTRTGAVVHDLSAERVVLGPAASSCWRAYPIPVAAPAPIPAATWAWYAVQTWIEIPTSSSPVLRVLLHRQGAGDYLALEFDYPAERARLIASVGGAPIIVATAVLTGAMPSKGTSHRLEIVASSDVVVGVFNLQAWLNGDSLVSARSAAPFPTSGDVGLYASGGEVYFGRVLVWPGAGAPSTMLEP